MQIFPSVASWRDAIYLACRPLEQGGFITKDYAQKIIEDTTSMGAYYVLIEDVALIHARPEDGVISSQLAVTLLEEPVQFTSDSFPARLLITLAASDADSHLETMQALAQMLMDPNRIADIVSLRNEHELYRAFITE